jgi:hypothetical protein
MKSTRKVCGAKRAVSTINPYEAEIKICEAGSVTGVYYDHYDYDLQAWSAGSADSSNPWCKVG